MKKNNFFILGIFLLLNISCNFPFNEKVTGNGKLTTENRTVSDASKIKSYGNFDVEIMPGSSTSIKIEADENLMPYIITEEKNGYLEIHEKNNVNLSSQNKIRISITTNQLQEVELTGNGDVKGNGKFSGADRLKLSVTGTGNITLDVNTPAIDSHIAGTGNIILSGETKDSKIDIAGVGDYKAENLKAENVDVHIAGSGNAKVFAENTLSINIAGSGDVYYAGNATVTQHVAGSGNIKRL